MAQVSYVEPEQAAGEVKQVYQEKLKGKPGNIQKALAHTPEILKAFLGFYASIGKSLERRLYELVYIRVSMINGCQYWMQHHLASSKRAGLTPQDWQALKNPESAPFTEKEKLALRFAEKLTRTPTNDSAAEGEALKPHFTEEQRVDLTCLVALVNCTNRITDGLGLELDIPKETI